MSWLTCKESGRVQRVRFDWAFSFFFFLFFRGNFQDPWVSRDARDLQFAVGNHGEAVAEVLRYSAGVLETWVKSCVRFRFLLVLVVRGVPGVDSFDVLGGHLPTATRLHHVAAVLQIHAVPPADIGAWSLT